MSRGATPFPPTPWAHLQPYNAGSAQDTAALVAHIYGPLGADLDFIVPFAAVSEAGASADALTGANEVRRLLPSLLPRSTCARLPALAGGAPRDAHERAATRRARRRRQEARGPHAQPRPRAAAPVAQPRRLRRRRPRAWRGEGPSPAAVCQRVSSLPPLQYAESKLGLEALCHKWGSEGWGDYVSIAGAVIGWTRGTGLMAENNGEEISALPLMKAPTLLRCRSRLGGRRAAGLPHVQPGGDGLLPHCPPPPAHGPPGASDDGRGDDRVGGCGGVVCRAAAAYGRACSLY